MSERELIDRLGATSGRNIWVSGRRPSWIHDASGGERIPGRSSTLALTIDGVYHRPVQDHLDLQGASGATYRFRLIAEPGQLPATSGNFAYVRWRGARPEVSCLGAVNSLGSASRVWDEAVRAHGASGLYVRLNVARAARDQEHADLVEKHQPPMVSHAEA